MSEQTVLEKKTIAMKVYDALEALSKTKLVNMDDVSSAICVYNMELKGCTLNPIAHNVTAFFEDCSVFRVTFEESDGCAYMEYGMYTMESISAAEYDRLH